MLFATASISTAWTFLGDVAITLNKTKNIVGCRIQIRLNLTIMRPLDIFHPPIHPIQRFNSTLIKVLHSVTCKWTGIEWYLVTLSVGARDCGLIVAFDVAAAFINWWYRKWLKFSSSITKRYGKWHMYETSNIYVKRTQVDELTKFQCVKHEPDKELH